MNFCTGPARGKKVKTYSQRNKKKMNVFDEMLFDSIVHEDDSHKDRKKSVLQAKDLNVVSNKKGNPKQKVIKSLVPKDIKVENQFIKSDVRVCIVGDSDPGVQVCHLLGGTCSGDIFTDETTHVVVANESSELGTSIIKGILCGAWVLTLDWLLKSGKKGKWLKETKYEKFPISKTIRQWRSRQEFKDRYFSGQRFYVSPDADASEECWLIKSMNGSFVSSPWEAEFVIYGKGNSGRECSRNWMVDCLLSGKVLPHSEKITTNEYETDEYETAYESPSSHSPCRVTRRKSAFVVSSAPLLCKVFDFLSRKDLTTNVPYVNRRWNVVLGGIDLSVTTYRELKRYCENYHDALLRNSLAWNCFKGMCSELPRGEYLSRGTYKKVFKVWSERNQRYEAISVMDIYSICSTDSPAIALKEVDASLRLSALVTTGRCANFLETYQIFVLSEDAPVELWGDSGNEDDTDDDASVVEDYQGLYLYTRMELCDKGDLEEYIKAQPDMILGIDTTRCIFFQMCFALYIGQCDMNLRHFDIKLLNFILKPVSNVYTACVEDIHFEDAHTGFVVKLIDYGSVDMTEGTLNCCVSKDHFQTFENVPPEYLLRGDAKTRGADSFALGLSMVHLFTGTCPYEEMMEEVCCPEYLKKSLRKNWQRKAFHVLQSVKKEYDCDVFCDTLYRYLVLVGLPSCWGSNEGDVTSTIDKLLRKKDKNTRRASDVLGQFGKDQEQFSLLSGTHHLIQRARKRLEETGAMPLLKGLLDLDPEKRLNNMESVIKDSFFSPLVTSK
mmetsp:Transcript_20731/g.33778  ORF Transcript_20731/g.33778 Transcript_20731/m.33778 type:complete len:781 (+) Transcript_20731:88-2430(+)